MCHLLPDGKQRINKVEKKLETKCDVNEVKEIVNEAMGTQERAPTTHISSRPVQCRIGQSWMRQLRRHARRQQNFQICMLDQ